MHINKFCRPQNSMIFVGHSFIYFCIDTTFKKMRRRKKTDSLRFQLGISQDLMALWLGTSRSLYSMYEGYQRSLPSQASLKQSHILLAWTKFQENWKAEAQLPEPPSDDALFRIRILIHKLKMAQYAREDLERQPDFQKAIAFFENLLSTPKDDTEKLVCQLQITHLKKEKNRVEKEKKRLSNEMEMMEKELEILKRGILSGKNGDPVI